MMVTLLTAAKVRKSNQHLVNLMLDREMKHDKTKFADIDLKDFQNQIRTKRMLGFLEKKTADTDLFKKEIRC